MHSRLDAVVVGAGIAGLAAAHRLRALGVQDLLVLEATGRVGGKVSSVELGGRFVDAGPDSFITRHPAAYALCLELGLEDELVAPAPLGAALWVRGRLRPIPKDMAGGVPHGPAALARSGSVSAWGLARAALERVLPVTPPDGDLSVGELVRSRFGDEVFETVVDPLVSGIFAGDADRLSAEAVVPHLFEALRQGRRLSGLDGHAASRPAFLTVRGGLERITRALANGPRVRTEAPVIGMERLDGAYRLHLVSGEHVDAASIVLATPPAATASLLGLVCDAAARLVLTIVTAPIATVVLRLPQGVELPTSTGFLVPKGQRRLLVGCTYLSRKWPHLASDQGALVRCAVGRDGDSRWIAMNDGELAGAVVAELGEAIGATIEPEAFAVRRFAEGIPQYRVGHHALVDQIDAELERIPGLAVAGSAYRGVGLPACIASGRSAAERVAAAAEPTAV